ncbi:MAG: LysE family translocator [Gemmobacter sp.]
MTLTLNQLLLFAGTMAALWAVPGPVWVALIARSLSDGMRGAWPLAVAVVLGDMLWAASAIFGLAWVLSLYGGLIEALRWVAAGMFLIMGVMLIRAPAAVPGSDSRMTRPGVRAGFTVGLLAILGNPKAILFYMGVLPGFFDLARLTAADVAAILLVAGLVPLVGNLGLALFLDRARRLVSSPKAVARMNVGSGILLILVGMVIPFA